MEYRRGRGWRFADCAFDEANWALTVGGRRVPVEIKPLELLRELLMHAGNVVSKAELLDAIWPNIAVVEASLPTAIHKLRHALNDEDRESPIIQTVPRIGYRLAVPVEVEEFADAPGPLITRVAAEPEDPPPVPPLAGDRAASPLGRGLPIAAGAIGILALAAAMVAPARHGPATPPRATYSQQEVLNALRRLDVARIDAMIAKGWNPQAPLDGDRNNALNRLLEMCEWDPGHDRAKMLIVARALVDGGIDLRQRNVWGDTPYSIASARRYCGPDHPVTRMIHNMCFSKSFAAGKGCLADYKHYKQID